MLWYYVCNTTNSIIILNIFALTEYEIYACILTTYKSTFFFFFFKVPIGNILEPIYLQLKSCHNNI